MGHGEDPLSPYEGPQTISAPQQVDRKAGYVQIGRQQPVVQPQPGTTSIASVTVSSVRGSERQPDDSAGLSRR